MEESLNMGYESRIAERNKALMSIAMFIVTMFLSAFVMNFVHSGAWYFLPSAVACYTFIILAFVHALYHIISWCKTW